MRKYLGVSTVVVVLLFCAVFAQATITPVTFNFYNVSNNNPANAAIGELQLSVTVSNGNNQITFTFENTPSSGQPCTIAEIYFDDGHLLGINSVIDNPPEVDFQHDSVAPKQMPGSELVSPEFVAIESFSLEPENPAPEHGVDPGEQLVVVFDLQNGGSDQDVLNELYDGRLRIGLHVVSIGEDAGSESFINELPEPASIVLLGMGVLALVRKRKR